MIKMNIVQFKQWGNAREQIFADLKRKHIESNNATLIVKIHNEMMQLDSKTRPCCANVWNDYINAIEDSYKKYMERNKKEVYKKTEQKQPKKIIGDAIKPKVTPEGIDLIERSGRYTKTKK